MLCYRIASLGRTPSSSATSTFIELELVSTVAGVGLAACFPNMWSRSGPGSALCLRQRGLCGKGPCHAIRMCGGVLWVLRKRARSAALSAGLITAWKN